MVEIKVIIPNIPFDEIVADKINPLALQWLINNSVHDRFDGSAKHFMLQACNLANIYKEDLHKIYDDAVSARAKEADLPKLKKVKGE